MVRMVGWVLVVLDDGNGNDPVSPQALQSSVKSRSLVRVSKMGLQSNYLWGSVWSGSEMTAGGVKGWNGVDWV